jgi:hypothetical protein
VTYCAEKGHAGFYIDAYRKDAQASQGTAPQQRGGFMTTQERNRALSEANMRAFLEEDCATPFDSLPPANDPYTIEME